MGILIRLAISALALWISTLILKGNTLGCALYILTLGLIALVVNGLLLLLTSWIAGKLDLPFHVDKFWPTAVLGALIVRIISWVLNMFVPDGKDNGKDKD